MRRQVVARASEFETIQRFFAPLSAEMPGAFGLTNDAAVWRPEMGYEAVITTDCMVAEVHFLADDPPDLIAGKLLAVNLSDIAAMGARPSAYTLAVAWPADADDNWIEAFAKGLSEAQSGAGVALIGGDTVATPGPLTLSLTAFGEIPLGDALSRGGAQHGDDIYVTGTIGDAALGLKLRLGELSLGNGEDRDFLIGRYRLPQARSDLGVALPGVASAAIDISDGLLADLDHIAKQSGMDMEIQAADIPISAAARSCIDEDSTLMALVFGGGDDYELAFSAPSDKAKQVLNLANKTATPIRRIGCAMKTMDVTPEVRLLDQTGRSMVIEQHGFRHF
jgi:thiamine-monophosphate kinase